MIGYAWVFLGLSWALVAGLLVWAASGGWRQS